MPGPAHIGKKADDDKKDQVNDEVPLPGGKDSRIEKFAMVIGPDRLGREDSTDGPRGANARDRLGNKSQASASQGADHINKQVTSVSPNPFRILTECIEGIHIESDMHQILVQEGGGKKPPPLVLKKSDGSGDSPGLDLLVKVLRPVPDDKNSDVDCNQSKGNYRLHRIHERFADGLAPLPGRGSCSCLRTIVAHDPQRP